MNTSIDNKHIPSRLIGFATAGRAFSVEIRVVLTETDAMSSSPTRRSTSGCFAAADGRGAEVFLVGLRAESGLLGV